VSIDKRLLDKIKLVRSKVKKSELLSSIFDEDFFKDVKKQIIEKKDKPGPLISIFIWLIDDIDNDGSQIDSLEKYLQLIISHPGSKKKHINDLKAQLRGNQALEALFEISVIGNLLNAFGNEKISLYPKTTNNRNVELSIRVIEREVFIEVTALMESKKDREERERVYCECGDFRVGPLCMEYYSTRFESKLRCKSNQFPSEKPTALMVYIFDFWPDRWAIEDALKDNHFERVGLLLQFRRKKLVGVFDDKEIFDENNSLTPKEKECLVSFFSGEEYKPLYYL
jgi:hypothetical protein